MSYAPPLNEPIAIIGSSCRFPGNASSPSKLWELLLSPRDISKRPPADRFNLDGFYHVDTEHHGTTNVEGSYFLEEDVRLFDAAFFNITPKEAEAIDPQQRLLLESVYEAMESAGCSIRSLQGSSTSVYAGLMIRDYMDVQVRDPDYFSKYMVTGTSSALNANRISYFFDWNGPSLTIDTACSSSLVALHQAVLGLRSGESRIACVCGSNLLLGPELFISAANLHMLSSRSRMWDISAEGYARGDGFATLLLKRLSDAIRDGDNIEALIRETGVNSDGRTKGITMPSSDAQATLIRETYLKSGLDPTKDVDRCQYFEAHGTGTLVGDPQEAGAIHAAFYGNSPVHSQKMLVGSIKTVVGHTEGCAGLAGVLKAILALRHKSIPPNLHYYTPNPNVVPFLDAFEIPTTVLPWPTLADGCPRRASVNSFGFGGTNSHIILESYELAVHNCLPWVKQLPSDQQISGHSFAPLFFAFSANNEQSLLAMINQYIKYLSSNVSVNLRDLSWTLMTRRTTLPVRASFVASSALELSEKLRAEISCKRSTVEDFGFYASGEMKSKPVVLGVFTGQGAQWATMGRDLLIGCAKFSNTIERLENSLKSLPDPPDWSLKAEIMAAPSQSRLSEAVISQPLCTAIQIGLVDVLECAGITFSVTVGHSSGEIAAAYSAGVITAEEGVRIAYYRGVHAHLARSDSGVRGSMLAVGMSLEDAQALIDSGQFKGRVNVAASNSSASVTLSGDEDAIEEARQHLIHQKKFARVLQVDTAYHSHHMFPCAEPYISSLKACKVSPQAEDSSRIWISSVYGSKGTPTREDLTAKYWSRNMTQIVLFSQALERAVVEAGPFDAVVEVGPHPALKGPATQTLKDLGQNPPYVGVLDRKSNDAVALASALAFLWCRLGSFISLKGYEEAFVGGSMSIPVVLKDLPTYPWDHVQPYWTESRLSKDYRTRSSRPHELLGHISPGNPENELKWRNILRREEVPWLPDYNIQGQVLLPAGAFCAMMLDAALVFTQRRTVSLIELLDVQLRLPVAIPETSRGVELVTSIKQLEPHNGRSGDGQKILELTFTLSSGMPDGSTPLKVAATSRVRITLEATIEEPLPQKTHCDEVAHLKPVDIKHFYSAMREVGLSYNNGFSVLDEAERGWDFASAIMPMPSSDGRRVLSIDPSWVESCIQLGYLAFAYPGDGKLWTAFVPQRIGKLSFAPSLQKSKVHGHGTVLGITSRIGVANPTTGKHFPSFVADFEVCDPATNYTWMQIDNVVFSSLNYALRKDDRELFFSTIWKSDTLEPRSVAESMSETRSASAIHQLLDKTAIAYLQDMKSKGTFRAVPRSYQPLADFIQRECNTHSAVSLSAEYHHHETAQITAHSSPAVDLRFMKTLSELLQNKIRSTERLENALFSTTSLVEIIPALGALDTHLGSITQTLQHRFPQLQVVEIGSHCLAQSRSIVAALEGTTGSYVFGNVGPVSTSEQILDPAVKEVKLESLQQDQLHKLRELSPAGFDLIVTSYLVHGRQTMDSIVQGVRQLLKPGGFLLLVEPTKELIWLKYLLYGALEAEDDQALGLPVSPLELDKALRSSMFSGVDHIADYSGISVITTQALDNRIAAFRDPLHPDHMSILSGDLIFIGDGHLTTYRHLQDTLRLLHGWKGKIVVKESLEVFIESRLNLNRKFGAVLILNDFRTPQSLTSTNRQKYLQKAQDTLHRSNNILWVTLDGEFNDPIHAANVASSRYIARQVQDTKFQSVLVESTWNVGHSVASSLVRFLYAHHWKLPKATHLWKDEDEVKIKNHETFIPRVLPVREPNDRLNSSRRSVVRRALDAMREITIDMLGSIDSLEFHPQAKSHAFAKDKHSITKVNVKVSYSSLLALRVGLHDYLHVCIGQVPGQGGTVIALSETLSNSIDVDRSWQIPFEANESEQRSAIEMTAQFLSATWISNMLEMGTAVIYEPPESLAFVLSDLVSGTNKQVVFLTSDQEQVCGTSSARTFVHRHSSRSTVQALVPRDTDLFINMGSAENPIAQRIREIVSPNFSTEKDALFRIQSRVSPQACGTRFIETLKLAKEFVLRIKKGFPEKDSNLLNSSKLVGKLECPGSLSIVSWTDAHELPLETKSLDTSTLIAYSKTYLLANVCIALAEPLARWLVSGGSRHIIIAESISRHALHVAPPAWVAVLRKSGVQIDIEEIDLASQVEVYRLRQKYSSIAGLVFGGNPSLEESSHNLSHTIFQAATNLDESFSSRDLDFFVLLTSFPATAEGSVESETMTFMEALATRRKKRGLNVSSISLPGTWGDNSSDDSSAAKYFSSVTESDIFTVLNEAIAWGRDARPSPHLITALKRTGPSSSSKSSKWWSRAKFSHLLSRSDNLATKTTQDTGQGLKQKLAMTKSSEEATKTLQHHFVDHLEVMLNLGANSVRDDTDLVGIGIDSLMASDIRSWFLKELGVDVPVLKILGGSTVRELCEEFSAGFGVGSASESTLINVLDDLQRERSSSPSLHSFSMPSSLSGSENVVALSEDDAQSIDGFVAVGIVSPPAQPPSSVSRCNTMSNSQTRLWFPTTYLEQETPFNCTTSYRIVGPFDVVRLTEALKKVTQRHEIFRTTFRNEKASGEPIQSVLAESCFKLQVLSGNKTTDVDVEFRRIANHAFHLEDGDSLIASIISHDSQEHTIIFGYHHIIMDGMSWQITLNEMASKYNDLEARLPSPTQYLEFTARQQHLIKSGAHASKLAFWKKEFPELNAADPIPLFPFAKVGTRRTLTRYSTLDIVESIDAELVSSIRKASLSAKATSFHFYLSTFQAMISRFLDIDDVCIGVIDANRSDQAFLGTIGFLLELLPLRLPLNKKERFATTLANTRKKSHAALSNSGVPLESIVRELNVSTSPTDTPLFQVLINYRMGALRSPRLGDSNMTFLNYEDAKAPFDLTLSIDEKDDGTGMLTFSIQDYIYDKEGADLIVKTYMHFLRVLSDNTSLRVNEIPLSVQSLVQRGIEVGTGSVTDFKWSSKQTVIHQVDQWARTQPHAVAVKDLLGGVLTYQQMLARTSIFAHAITKAGATVGSSVAVFCEPTVDTICCIFSILRLGAAYTPLDVRNSQGRLQAVIEECKPRVILFHSATKTRLRDLDTEGSSLVDIQSQTQTSEDIFPNLSTPAAPALVLYTSGSTGKPKGITMSHYNLAVQCTSIGKRLGIDHDVVLQQSALGFDAAIAQIFYALVFGGTVIMADNRQDPTDLASMIEREKVTVTLFIISEMASLLDHASSTLARCHHWRIAMCGGEAFAPSLIRRFRSLSLPGLGLYNAYGPTEGTIISSIGAVPYHTVEFAENYIVPVGPPIPNYGVYVLDENSQPVPLGWPGELCIAGPGVTLGYVGQPELTAAKFKPDKIPRPRGPYPGWDRIYKTGDRARLLDDGSFLFLGRIDGDSQIKLRGIRIELDEVANSILRKSDGVLSSAVVRVRGDNNQILVAFVVFSDQSRTASISKPQIYLRHLLQSLPLPVYMRPAVAVPVESMPFTERGKLDTKALAKIPLSDFQEETDVTPRHLNATELKMKLVWEDVLSEVGTGLQIDKDSDFFSVGGNSLLLMRLKAKILEAFGVSIPLIELFQATTLESLASKLNKLSFDQLGEPEEVESCLDWDTETALPTLVTSTGEIARRLESAKQPLEPFSVILTGSTGFLGRELLAQLVAHPSVACVHCIAVRPGRTHKVTSPKVRSHQGDLYQAQFGLDDATARTIFSTATAIIHNGAEVSHMKSYYSLRTPNVISTKELVRLSIEYGIGAIPRFHYVSSAGVGHLVPAPTSSEPDAVDTFPPISLLKYPPPGDGSDGYVAAKWASEVTLERAVASIPGFNAVIHRPSNITGTGVGENDIVHSLLRFSIALKSVPDMSGATGAFDFISLEACAADIVRGVLVDPNAQSTTSPTGTLRYEHRSGEIVVPVEKLSGFLAAKSGTPELEVLPWERWIDKALGAGLNPLVGEFLRELDGKMRMPLLSSGDH